MPIPRPRRTATTPPEYCFRKAPKTAKASKAMDDFANGFYDFAAIGRKHGITSAYVEKIYFRYFLPRKLMYRIAALEQKL